MSEHEHYETDHQGADGRLSSARYPNVLRAVFETPWAIRPETLQVIVSVVSRRVAGERLSAEEIQDRIGAGPAGRPRSQQGAVAVIPIYGVIMPRATMFSDISGGTALTRFSAALAEAANDPQIESILLDIDSPGGSVSLVPETAAMIRQARTKKAVVAVANTMAGSAAYYLAAQADEIVVTPSGAVGSIGVYAAHEDFSAFDEKLGVKTTLISAGKYKVEGNEYEPLSEEARAAIQEQVDTFYGMFVADVAKGRGVPVADVRDGYGEGRMVLAKQAVTAGMADRVDTFDGTVSRLMAGKVARRSVRAEASLLNELGAEAAAASMELDVLEPAAIRGAAEELAGEPGEETLTQPETAGVGGDLEAGHLLVHLHSNRREN